MYSLPLYSILQDLFTFYNIVVCIILLSLLYCNPSCCPLATLAITTLKFLPYRADSNISDLTDSSNTTSNKGITTAVELEQLQNKGKTFTLQELKKLNTRVKALEEIACIEDRLRLLENRKHPRDSKTSDNPRSSRGPSYTTRPSRGPSHTSVLPSVELDNSDSGSTNSVAYHRHKRLRYTKGIKVTPSYTLKISSSLRE